MGSRSGKGLRRHLSFANVASGLALFVALGGGTAIAITEKQEGAVAKRALGSGDLVRGVIGARDNTGATTGSITALASLPRGVRLPKNPSDEDVTVEGGGDDAEHLCKGTVKQPTAPRGVVCVYTPGIGVNQAANIRGLAFVSGPRFAFRIAWEPTLANNHSFVEGVWAYRIP